MLEPPPLAAYSERERGSQVRCRPKLIKSIRSQEPLPGIIDRQVTAIIPMRKSGWPWKEDCPAARARNETLRATWHYGRAFWKRWTGYRIRSRIEAMMRCLKACGERIAARDKDRQIAEIRIRIALMNGFSSLGTVEIVRMA
jgi:hypothetical protein